MKMRAVQVSAPGGDFELVQREIPEPQEGQVRIRVLACGVCHGDSIVKDGGGHVLRLNIHVFLVMR